MLYEIAHIIKHNCSFLWDLMEWGNSVIFSLLYKRKLKLVENAVGQGVPYPYKMRRIAECDITMLHDFFLQQPDEAFNFFKPHDFDISSLKKLVKNRSFLSFILVDKCGGQDAIVGYSFLRSFINGSSYRGYIVDYRHRGKGIAKMMGYGLNRVGDTLKLKMFKSISPNNPASMKVTQDVCDVEKIRLLNNGDYLMKCTTKQSMKTQFGGGQ